MSEPVSRVTGSNKAPRCDLAPAHARAIRNVVARFGLVRRLINSTKFTRLSLGLRRGPTGAGSLHKRDERMILYTCQCLRHCSEIKWWKGMRSGPFARLHERASKGS